MIKKPKQTVMINTQDGTVNVSGKCVFTGVDHSVTVSAEGYAKWLSGVPVQEALCSSCPDDREFIVSGISPQGWPDDPDEEDWDDSELP